MALLPPEFDPDTVALMGRVCDAVWNELQSRSAFVAPTKETDLHTLIVNRVRAGVVTGERDPDKLRKLALIGMGGAGHSAPILASAEGSTIMATALKRV
jgi:hypothetical protein